MKAKILVVTVAMMAGVLAIRAEEISGYIIYRNDTVEVMFDIPFDRTTNEPDYEKLQKKVRYFAANGKRKTLKPAEAVEIQFDLDGALMRMLTRNMANGTENPYTTEPVFLKLRIEGRLRMFEHHYTMKGSTNNRFYTGPTKHTDYLVQRRNEKLRPDYTFPSKKVLKEYFNDCPALVGKIESGEWGRDDLEEMVLFYNRTCEK